MQSVIILLASVAFLVSLVAVVRPLPRIGLPSRKRAAGVLVASVIVAGVAAPPTETEAEPAAQKVAAEPAVAPEDNPAPAQEPAREVQVAEAPKPAGLSDDAKEIEALYNELQEFKDDPEFHEVGFAVCCRFNEWKRKVEDLRDRTGVEVLQEVGFVPGDLLMLGMDYMRNKGQPTSYSRDMEATIAAGLKPQPELGQGQGVVVSEDRACRNLDSFRRWQEAMLAERYAEASEAITGPDCPRLYPKMVVTGPMATEKVRWGSDSVRTYHQVKTEDGVTLWVGDGHVEFQ